MESINKVELQGYVGSSRIIDTGGRQILHFSLATNHAFEAYDSNIVETTWHDVIANAGDGMPDFNTIVKGTPLNVIGRIRISRYTDFKGNEKTVYEILAEKITILKN